MNDTQTLKPRNVFVRASASDMAKINKQTSDNLKIALIAINVYDGRLKNYEIEEASFSFCMQIALSGERDPVGLNGLKDCRTVNKYVRKALNQMGLNEVAKNYLLGDQDQNDPNDNRLLEGVLNQAIGIINPYKVTEMPDAEIQSKIDDLNGDFEASIEGKIDQLKRANVFAYCDPSDDKPFFIGKIRRLIS